MRRRIEVLVPFLEGCEYRQRALEWVLPRYRWPVRLAYGARPWCKAEALMPAVAASRASIVILADADVWTSGLPAAVEAVEAGAPWAMPHRSLHRLSERSTDELRSGASWEALALDERAYRGMEGGGMLVARREALLETPLDPRFIGWGGEDEAHGHALRCLLGEPWRGWAHMVHLWHPPQERLTRKVGSIESRVLLRQYRRAKRNPEAMRKIINDARISFVNPLPDHRPS